MIIMHQSSLENLRDYIREIEKVYSSIREAGYDVFVYRPNIVKNFNRVKMFRLSIKEREQADDGSIRMNDSDLNLLRTCLGEHIVKSLEEGKARIFLFNPKRSNEFFNLRSLEEVASGNYAFLDAGEE